MSFTIHGIQHIGVGVPEHKDHGIGTLNFLEWIFHYLTMRQRLH